jgi:hypothetical protein
MGGVLRLATITKRIRASRQMFPQRDEHLAVLHSVDRVQLGLVGLRHGVSRVRYAEPCGSPGVSPANSTEFRCFVDREENWGALITL